MNRDWNELTLLATKHGHTLAEVGVVLVDHGSRREESNELLLDVARQMQHWGPVQIVEPAHMELSEPSIRTALLRCVERGAKLIIVSPFFLAPGRHWTEDIPQLVSQAARETPGVHVMVAGPLAPHPLLIEILWQRMEELR